jgi:hypothetical protein
MTEFASALNKINHDEMAALSGAAATDDLKHHHNGRIYALERKMLKVESRLAKVEAKLADANGLWNAAAAAPGALPAAPAADTDPAA